MPVCRHPESLLQPSSTAKDHQTDSGTVLPRRAIIEIDLRVRANSPANVRANEPGVELRSRYAGGGKNVVQCIPAVDGSRPVARELMVRRPGKCIARRSQEYAGSPG